MTDVATTILLAMVAFQVKHFVCDFILQTTYQYKHKGIYGHAGGLIHAGLHLLGSIPALLILTANPLPIMLLLAAEFLIHYHIDWSKVWLDKRFNLSVDSHAYWIVFGLDQFVHQLTYIGMIFVVLKYF